MKSFIPWLLAMGGLLLFSCQAKNPRNSFQELPAPSRTSPSVNSLAAPSSPRQDLSLGPILARLLGYHPKVTYRRKSELVWQDVTHGLEFRRFDLIQTHLGASAQVSFVNGSELSLQENSLAIINMDQKKTLGDRVVVRKGRVSGSTAKDFWILTPAALLRMRGEGASKPAHASLQVEEGKKVVIALEKGQATLLKLGSEGQANSAPIELKIEEPVSIPALRVSDEFGLDEEDQKLWIPESLFEPVSTRSRIKPTPSPTASDREPVSFTVEEPKDRIEVILDSILVQGRVSDPQAVILVNGKRARVLSDRRFELSADLEIGVNPLVIQLVSPDGTSRFERRTVIRKE